MGKNQVFSHGVLHTRLTATEVHRQLIAQKGYKQRCDQLFPSRKQGVEKYVITIPEAFIHCSASLSGKERSMIRLKRQLLCLGDDQYEEGND